MPCSVLYCAPHTCGFQSNDVGIQPEGIADDPQIVNGVPTGRLSNFSMVQTLPCGVVGWPQVLRFQVLLTTTHPVGTGTSWQFVDSLGVIASAPWLAKSSSIPSRI